MKKPETKIKELKELLGMEKVPPEQFIQFVVDVVDSMPDLWKSAAERAYLRGGMQLFDETTGKPLQTDSRYHIMNEHSRKGFVTLVTLARKHKNTLKWLLEIV